MIELPRNSIARITFATFVISLAGCQSRVGIGDGITASPDRSFAVEVSSGVRYRNQYVDDDETPKDIQVTLTRTGKCLFCQTYTVMGWDVSWQTRWTTETDVRIDIFDFGRAVDHRTSQTPTDAKRALGTIELHVDPTTNNVRSSGFVRAR